MMGLVFVQVGLGLYTWQRPSIPNATAHVAVGALILASSAVTVVNANAWFATWDKSESLSVSLMFVSAAARAELSQMGSPLAQNTVESMSTVAIRRGIVNEYIKELNKRTS
jgi:hypothetical protein